MGRDDKVEVEPATGMIEFSKAPAAFRWSGAQPTPRTPWWRHLWAFVKRVVALWRRSS